MYHHRLRSFLDSTSLVITTYLRCSAVPSCIMNLINTMMKVSDLDHFQRIALVLYLKRIGFTVDDVVEFFRKVY